MKLFGPPEATPPPSSSHHHHHCHCTSTPHQQSLKRAPIVSSQSQLKTPRSFPGKTAPPPPAATPQSLTGFNEAALIPFVWVCAVHWESNCSTQKGRGTPPAGMVVHGRCWVCVCVWWVWVCVKELPCDQLYTSFSLVQDEKRPTACSQRGRQMLVSQTDRQHGGVGTPSAGCRWSN